jgi:uncharacterized repeat protein (TIGR03803 family)
MTKSLATVLCTTVVSLLLAAPDVRAQSFEVLARFSSGPLNPLGHLEEGDGGFLYGTTPFGGSFGKGTIYRVAPWGEVTVVHSFDGSTGAFPLAGLTVGHDGALYGTARQGGTGEGCEGWSGCGTVFRISQDDYTVTVVHAFAYGADGGRVQPTGRLLQANDGWLYGSVSLTNHLFRIDPESHELEWLAQVGGGTWSSWGDPALAPTLMGTGDGRLLGTVVSGGQGAGYGAVFEIDAMGLMTVLHAFAPAVTGARPLGGLVELDEGFYGITETGGPGGGGTVFRLDHDGAVTVVHAFTYGDPAGYYPFGTLFPAPEGEFYVTLSRGGTADFGVLYRLGTDGTLTPVHEFARVADANRRTPLTLAGGYLYGAVQGCGRSISCDTTSNPWGGAVYRVEPASGASETVHTFNSTEAGANPTSPVMQAQDGAFYGVTEEGGAYGYGVVYRMDPDGTLTTLHSFDGNDGYYVSSALAEGDGGWLYGTTVYSEFGMGTGTLFRVNAAGDFETLSALSSEGPTAGVIRGRNGMFYGMMPNDGTVFRADGDGNLTELTYLPGSTWGPLTQDAEGFFHGATITGGDFDQGTVFRMDEDGTLTILHSFEPYQWGPIGVVKAPDGLLYGTTQYGGPEDCGTVFRLSAAGALEVLHWFGGDTGCLPSALVQGPDGLLYGTTQDYGPNFDGTIFRVGSDGAVTVLHAFDDRVDGSAPRAALTVGADGWLYGTASGGFNPDAAPAGIVFRLNATAVTPPGPDVEVRPVDPVTGTSPVSLTFGEITESGETEVSVATTGPALPDGFQLGDPPTFFDVTTTATFAGEIEICFSYAGVSVPDPATAVLLHYEGTRWEDVTTSRDLAAQIICGRVTSLSPFVVGNGATGGGTTRSGFYEPVSPEAGFVNTVKGGSTVPLKFEVTVNGVEKTDTAGLVFSVSQVPCEGGAEDPVDFVVAGSTSLRYDAAEGVFIQNWKTPKTTGACYVVRLTTESDGQSLQATFKTK